MRSGFPRELIIGADQSPSLTPLEKLANAFDDHRRLRRGWRIGRMRRVRMPQPMGRDVRFDGPGPDDVTIRWCPVQVATDCRTLALDASEVATLRLTPAAELAQRRQFLTPSHPLLLGSYFEDFRLVQLLIECSSPGHNVAECIARKPSAIFRVPGTHDDYPPAGAVQSAHETPKRGSDSKGTRTVTKRPRRRR